ncbi:MAG: hypothetical protein IPG77_01365 [Betaproteobacteria bacterium]|nr:hypothetical protein [Betaproteobacteria bacterium]
MANTLYFAIFPSGDATPTWDRDDIATNAGFSGTITAHGTDASAGATGTNYTPTISWTGSLTAGTSYKIAAVWDDGTNTSNVFASAAFRSSYTLALAAGTFANTGGDAAFLFNRAVEAAGGTFAYTGGDAALLQPRTDRDEAGITSPPAGQCNGRAAEHTLNAESAGRISTSGGDARSWFNRAQCG